MITAKGPNVNTGIKHCWTNRMETEMPYNHGEPVPPEIPKDERKLFAALRSYRRRRHGCELTVEDFEARRRWRPVGQRKTKIDRPQTAEGVAKILREKGLDRTNQELPGLCGQGKGI
jgi:hypothetical protein